jgi:hypothetical protein
VFKGVNEFNIELIEPSIFESAKANKKAGINVPQIAVKAIYFHLYNGICGICLNPTIIKNIEANKIRKLPN